MIEEKLTIPDVTEASWALYNLLRGQSLGAMKYGVLPNIVDALNKYKALDISLSSGEGYGGYTDEDDQVKIAEYHPKAIAQVAPAINALIQHMTAIMLIAKQVDAAFVENGKSPLFGIPFEVE